jgi:hypothetical protein
MTTTQAPARTLPLVAGGVLATIGTALALAGGAVLGIAGDDGMIASDHTRGLSTPTSALVSSTATIDGTDGFEDVASVVGTPEIGMTATSAKPGAVFIGVGPRDEVDRYLKGAAVDEATDFEVDPFELEVKRHAGTARPTPPAAQSFWAARSSGHRAHLRWKVRDGDWRLVVMNADGSRGVATVSRVEAGAEHLATFGLAILLAGVVTGGGGVALMVGKGRRRDQLV